jgi:hypothetical protein
MAQQLLTKYGTSLQPEGYYRMRRSFKQKTDAVLRAVGEVEKLLTSKYMEALPFTDLSIDLTGPQTYSALQVQAVHSSSVTVKTISCPRSLGI